MALELHVWGPAFGLSSIDPECIATVIYCQRVIPEGQWRLVASYDKSVGLTGMSAKQFSALSFGLHSTREFTYTV